MRTFLVDKLVRGSQNIDRMRAEIWAVVQMLIGLVSEVEQTEEDQEDDCVSFKFDGGEWLFLPSKLKPAIRCYLNGVDDGESGHWWIFTSDSSDINNCSMEHVQRVYEELPVLIEGMLKEFPELNEHIKPLLAAADKFPRVYI